MELPFYKYPHHLPAQRMIWTLREGDELSQPDENGHNKVFVVTKVERQIQDYPIITIEEVEH